MRLLMAANGEVFALAFSPDGDALAAAVDLQGTYLWNLHSAGVPVRLDPEIDERAATLFFAPDGRSVWWASPYGLKYYDRDDRETAEKPLGTHGLLLRFVRTPDGTRMVSEHNFPQHTLIGWSDGPLGWEQDWSLSTRELAVRALALDPTGARVAVLCQSAGKAERWWTEPVRVDLRSSVSGVVQASGPYPYDKAQQLIMSPDGAQLVAVHEMTLVVWPVPELGEPRLVRNDSRKHFTAAAYHPSGRYLFATSNDATVHVFDTRTWARVNRMRWRVGPLRSVAVSPDGTLAAAGGTDGGVVVWDVDL